MKVILKVLVGKSTGKEIAIPAPRFLIGRSNDCHLRPKSDSISRNHCTILTRKDRVMVRDLNSRNGTFVNGERISDDAQIRDGDQLQVGKLEFQVIVKKSSKTKAKEANPKELSSEERGAETRDAKAQDSKTREASEANGSARSGSEEQNPEEQNPTESGILAATIAEATSSNSEQEQRQPDLEEKPTPKPESTSQDPESLEFDVSEWLQEKDGGDPKKSEPETRLFQLDDTDQMAVATDEMDEGDTEGRKEKKKPGKLPTRSNAESNSSREAAADMLKKFFTSR
jgi:pSer/pThr/pTyr-binding forkhead associated (FHA) protein